MTQNREVCGLYSKLIKIWKVELYFTRMLPVADPGFSRGGGGCANSQKCYYFSTFFAENCMNLDRAAKCRQFELELFRQ